LRLVAKAALLLSLLAAAFFTAITAINIHDYHFTDDMPFREGDFRAVMSTRITGLACGLFGLLFYCFYLRRP